MADLFVKLIVLFGQGLVPFKLNDFMVSPPQPLKTLICTASCWFCSMEFTVLLMLVVVVSIRFTVALTTPRSNKA